MKRLMKKTMGITLAVALVCTSLAVAPEASAAKKAKKIVMNRKKVSLEVGQKFKLKVKKTKPAKASKKVTYKVNKKGKSVIKVTKKGKITALAVGKATVKVTSKSNKKAKAKVKVTVTEPKVQTTTVPTGTTAAPTGAATVAPTDAVKDPEATPTVKPTKAPTRTPRPTAAPTPTPAPPEIGEPSAPYTLQFAADTTVTAQDGATFEITADGVVITVTEQYGGVGFQVPENMRGNNYDTVTITWRAPRNVGTGFGCGLWRRAGSSEDDKTTEDVVAWDGIFTEGNSGTYSATITGLDATNSYYINKALFFLNDSDALANGSASVTITSVTFSSSEYDGPLPTATPQPKKLEAGMISEAITVDGIADTAWNLIPAIAMDSRVTCDNAGASDTTASLKLAWDANNLYGYAVIEDSNIDATAENDYQRDGFEFFMDEDNSKESSYDTNSDAFQYRFTGLTKDADGAKLPALSSIFAAGSDAARTAYEGIQIDYVYTATGYIVEFKVPFASAKEADDVIGFDAIVQDCQNSGRDAEIYLNDTTRTKIYYTLEDTFPELVLVAAVAPPTATPAPTPAPMAMNIPSVNSIVIDGIAESDWDAVPAVPMDSRVTCDNAGDSDTTASLKLAWDTNNLYGYAVVEDSNIDATAENDYQRDGFEIFMDEDNSKEASYDTNTDAFQYRFTGLTKDADGAKLPALTSIFAMGSDAARAAYEDIQFEYVFTATGYAVEFKVPFMTAKEADDVIGFDALVQDCNNGGRDAEIYFSDTTRTMIYYTLEDTFPALQLVQPTPEPTPEPTEEPTPVPTQEPTAEPAPTPEVQGNVTLGFANTSKPSWGTTATITNNADGTITIDWAADATSYTNVSFMFDTPLDLSGYERIIVDTVENVTMNFSILDAEKVDEWNNPASVGIRYGASFPLDVSLAELQAASNVGNADFTNVLGVSIFKGNDTDAHSITIKSITFVDEDIVEPTEVPATEAPATEAPATEAPATEVPATEAPATEAPATEAPATEVPATEAPDYTYEFPVDLSADYVTLENGTSLNEDGSVTIASTGINKDYVTVLLPTDIAANEYTKVTIEYDDVTIIEGNFSYKYQGTGDEKWWNFSNDTSWYINADETSKTIEFDATTYPVNKFVIIDLFGNSEMKNMTVKSIVFSKDKAEILPTEAPATEAPATEAPATEAPATEAPATEAPATEAPATEAPATEAPTVGTAVTLDANAVVVGGEDGAAVTVEEDGISYSRENGFSGIIIPIPASHVLNNKESFDINLVYESTGCDARVYLLSGPSDPAKSNIIGPGTSPLNGTVTASDNNVNYIFVKASSYNTTFTSLKIKSITLSDITYPEPEPTLSPETTSVSLDLNSFNVRGAATGDDAVVYNEDGSVTITYAASYQGSNIVIPSTYADLKAVEISVSSTKGGETMEGGHQIHFLDADGENLTTKYGTGIISYTAEDDKTIGSIVINPQEASEESPQIMTINYIKLSKAYTLDLTKFVANGAVSSSVDENGILTNVYAGNHYTGSSIDVSEYAHCTYFEVHIELASDADNKGAQVNLTFTDGTAVTEYSWRNVIPLNVPEGKVPASIVINDQSSTEEAPVTQTIYYIKAR